MFNYESEELLEKIAHGDECRSDTGLFPQLLTSFCPNSGVLSRLRIFPV
jgi:hypothetical protein